MQIIVSLKKSTDSANNDEKDNNQRSFTERAYNLSRVMAKHVAMIPISLVSKRAVQP